MSPHEETGSQAEADPLTGWLAAQTLRLNAGRARRMTLLVAGALAFGLALALAACAAPADGRGVLPPDAREQRA
jgi:hypothetical protein